MHRVLRMPPQIHHPHATTSSQSSQTQSQPQHQHPLPHTQFLQQSRQQQSYMNPTHQRPPPHQRAYPMMRASSAINLPPSHPHPQVQPQAHAQHPVKQQQQPSQQKSRQLTRTMSAPSESTAEPSQSVPTDKVQWRVAIDPKSKRPYYYHPVSRVTTWKKPQELVEQEKQERFQFFSSMESNIRLKLREGNWLRDSNTGGDGAGDAVSALEPEAEEDVDEVETCSSTSSQSSCSSTLRETASTHSAFSSWKQGKQSVSLPTTPARLGSHNNQTHVGEDSLAAATAPKLFRTLSSYETPVMNGAKKFVNGRLIALPSPIQERVQLASLDDQANKTVASDLLPPVPTRATSGSSNRETVSRPLRRRSNSTSTIYVPMGTMNAPDHDTTIQCVSTVLRAHMMEAQTTPATVVNPSFDLFINARDQAINKVPSLKEIGAFITHVFSRAQMESECIIMSLIYVERLLKATSGTLVLLPGNWRCILFCSMVMASKVWDDLSMCNADFCKIWPELTLKEMNEVELAYLSAVEYNVRVSAVSYAKYYFHLRSMCASMGQSMASFDESVPLNLDGARKMQVLSEEYQERSKLMPVPSRRRSATITAPPRSVTERAVPTSTALSLAAKNKWKTAKSSPAASLEQLVHMQSRVAGGAPMSSMRSTQHQ